LILILVLIDASPTALEHYLYPRSTLRFMTYENTLLSRVYICWKEQLKLKCSKTNCKIMISGPKRWH